MILNETQRDAVQRLAQAVASGAPIASLTGPAGTGKTTTIKALTQCLGEVEVVTPTNKAAQVLNSKGIPAATLYAKFFIKEETAEGKLYFTPCYQHSTSPEGKIAFSPVIIVDEASMLRADTVRHLSQMCRTLILVGDGNQLPPVNDKKQPRGFFNSMDHTAALTQVMRQAEGSEILALATDIRNSKNVMRMQDLNGDKWYPDDNFEKTFLERQPQLICFTNNTRRSINLRARNILGHTGLMPMAGDKMVCRNNYSDELLNGTQVVVREFYWPGKTREAAVTLESLVTGKIIKARMDVLPFLKDQPAAYANDYLEGLRGVPEMEDGLFLTYGYAITAHTAQGGEWESVVVVDERHVCRMVAAREYEDNPNSMVPEDYARRWIYTAVTRAKTHLAIADTNWVKY